MSVLFSRADKSVLGRWWWTVDRGLLAAFLFLALCGAALVATASPAVAERIKVGEFHFIIRHLIVLGPAMIVMMAMSLLTPRWVWRVASLVLAGSIAAMIVVLFVGIEIKGAQRWLDLPGFSLQPSEFAKVSFAIVAAWFMARQKEKQGFPGNRIAAGVFFVVLLLMLLQPDVGMSLVLASIYGTQIFLSGFPMIFVVAMAVLGVAGLVAAYFIFGHVQSRIDRFLNPASGDSYQVDHALEAFQSGGLTGAGPGQGVVKLDIPDAHADFIYAVAGEEFGALFALILAGVFLFIVLKGFKRVNDSEDMFVVLAAGGLLVMFGLQAFIHMGVNVNILPAKGMTLPFISYGGSSLLATAFGMGAVLALTRRKPRSAIARGGAVLRRG